MFIDISFKYFVEASVSSFNALGYYGVFTTVKVVWLPGWSENRKVSRKILSDKLVLDDMLASSVENHLLLIIMMLSCCCIT